MSYIYLNIYDFCSSFYKNPLERDVRKKLIELPLKESRTRIKSFYYSGFSVASNRNDHLFVSSDRDLLGDTGQLTESLGGSRKQAWSLCSWK